MWDEERDKMVAIHVGMLLGDVTVSSHEARIGVHEARSNEPPRISIAFEKTRRTRSGDNYPVLYPNDNNRAG